MEREKHKYNDEEEVRKTNWTQKKKEASTKLLHCYP